MAAGTLTACGGGANAAGGTPTLTWYINPDGGGSNPHGGGQAQIAAECTQAAQGRYRIKFELLPNSASDQRTQLLRRLAAGDSSMDIMSVDPAFITEFAAAGYFAPVPKNMTQQFTQDRVQSALDASKYKGKLIAVPFWANTQVLWYRKSVAQKAGLDMSKPVTWQQLIDAAQKTKKTIGVQAALYEGYSVWINALVEGAGGHIVDNPNATYENLKLGLDSPAGVKAAEVIRKVADTGVGGPAMGSSQETQSLNLFQGPSGGFLVNWPYVYAALKAAKVPWMKDVGFTRYPQTVAGKPSAPPFGGIEVAVGKNSLHPDLAYDAAACITNEKHQVDYMVATGNPASRKQAFNDPAVKKAFPGGLAALIRASLDEAKTRPLSPYWGDMSTALQQTFSPPGSVTPKTPAKAQEFIINVLNGKALL
ncbi:MAG TPA: extracellular solute-binding protein [Segeticoccus sp.]|uniref:extracellular solute-binding protein n=1 Tax=Segeticoccus sp. TaxID=2706531 RepID=UPI002D7E8F05|nr:extracellular solute-binding protein [Segeticoccus sp.]HET8599224.1 extracellular solute-binding protein [Segeticoccus sp.]